jgi:hypothetical protein
MTRTAESREAPAAMTPDEGREVLNSGDGLKRGFLSAVHFDNGRWGIVARIGKGDTWQHLPIGDSGYETEAEAWDAFVSASVSGDSVSVPRSEIEEAINFAEDCNYLSGEKLDQTIKSLRGWLSSSLPSAEATTCDNCKERPACMRTVLGNLCEQCCDAPLKTASSLLRASAEAKR